MTSGENNKPLASFDGASGVILPCSADQFANFIGDLLGKPQIIGRNFRGAIDIGYDDVVSLFHLLHHRLTEQNKAQLFQFSVTFSYDDQSSVTINGIEEFQAYAEVKHVETLSVTCSFEYLIQFSGRSHPERQAIDVSFNRGATLNLLSDSDIDLISLRRLSLAAGGTVFFRIKHTARSWGADIESLLSEHIKGLFREQSGPLSWLRHHSMLTGAPFALATFIGGLFVASSLGRYFSSITSSDAVSALSKMHDAGSAALLGIPILIRYQQDETSPLLIFIWVGMVVLSAIFAVFILAFISSRLEEPYPSFLTFTKADKSRKPRVLERRTRSFFFAGGAALVSILYGVIGNYLSYLIASIWGHH